MSVPTSLLLPAKMFPPAPGEAPFVSSSLRRTGVGLTWSVEEENLSVNFHDFKMLKANADVWIGMCFSNYRALRSTLRGSFFSPSWNTCLQLLKHRDFHISSGCPRLFLCQGLGYRHTQRTVSLCTYTARGGKYEMPSVQKPGCEFS